MQLEIAAGKVYSYFKRGYFPPQKILYKTKFKDEASILKAIGKDDYILDKEELLENCLYPKDKSISIGYYKSNIIICDDYQITNNSLDKADSLNLTIEENNLSLTFI